MAKLSNRTFGTEFEVFFSEDNWERFINDNRDKLEDEYGQMSAYQLANDHRFDALSRILNDNGFYYWKAVNDESIKGGKYGAEIVSPPLQGKSGLAEVMKMCKFLQPYAEVDQSTGLHVHIDAEDFKNTPNLADKLVSALLQYKNTEELFDKLVQAHRQGNESTYALGPGTTEEIISSYKALIRKEKDDLEGIIGLLQDGRYRKLNLASIKKHGTFEFRQLHGTLNPELVKNWIIICSTFVDSLSETEKTFTEFLKTIKNSHKGNTDYTINDIDNIIVHSALFSACMGVFFKGGGTLSDNKEFTAYENFLRNNLVKKPDLNGKNKSYIYRQIPASALQTLLDKRNEYDYTKEIGEASIERAKTSYQFRRFMENDGIIAATDAGIELLLPKDKLSNMMKIFGSHKRIEADQATPQEITNAQQLSRQTKNISNLTPRNFNKAYDQNQLSPLREEIMLLKKLLKKDF